MLPGIQVDILERAAEYLQVHFVEECELVTLDLIAHKHPDDVVLVHEGHDLLRHLGVTLDIVRAAQRS